MHVKLISKIKLDLQTDLTCELEIKAFSNSFFELSTFETVIEFQIPN